MGSRLARGFAQCHDQSVVYGACMLKNFDTMKQNCCAHEFDALLLCFRTKVKSGK